MAEPSIHEQLASLKHLGGSYNTGFGYLYTYSCPVTVIGYTTALNWTPRKYNATVSWNDGDGNLKRALEQIAGKQDNWNNIEWWDAKDGCFKTQNLTWYYLQIRAQDALKLSSGRDEVKIKIYLPFPEE